MPFIKFQNEFDFRFNNFIAKRLKKRPLYVRLTCFAYCIIQCAMNIMYRTNYALLVIWAVLALISLFALDWLIGTPTREFPLKQRTAMIYHIKEKCLMVLFAGLGFYFFKTLFESNQDVNPYVSFISGFDLVIVIFLFQHANVRWDSVLLAVFLLMLALIINTWAINTGTFSVMNQLEITFRFLIVPVYVAVFAYLFQANAKETFQDISKLEDTKTILDEILNLVPESIVVMGTDLQPLYYNNIFKNLMKNIGETVQALDSFFSRFTNLSKVTMPLRSKIDLDVDVPVSVTTNELKTILVRFVHKMQEGIWGSDIGLNTFTNQYETHQEMFAPIVYQGTYMKPSQTMQFTTEDAEIDILQKERTVEIKLIPIKYDGDHAILMIIRHAPEIKYVEQLKKVAKYKDEILASVSHELRTPINSNMNLINEAIKSDEVSQYVKENLLDPAFKSGRLLLNLVNDILDMSQIKEGKLKLVSQACEIRKVIQECHYLFEHQCRQKKIALNLSIDKRVPLKIRTDPNRFTQIVLNLLSNAYKFTLEGSITIAMTLEKGGLIKISVIDTGIGIKEEDIGKLMKKFEKIDLGENDKFNSMGAGLGLSIANSLAVMLGPKESNAGGLKFSSVYGKGTTASFLIKSRRKFVWNSRTAQPTRGDSPAVTLMKKYNSELKTKYLLPVDEEEDSSGFLEEENNPSSVYEFQKKDTKLDTINSDWKEDGKYRSSEKKYTAKKNLGLCVLPSCECPQVMIVDDDAFNVLTLQTLLSSLQIKCEAAHSGIECLKTIQSTTRCSERCTRFQLILMDGNMPLKDGYTTARELVEWNCTLEDPWNLNIVGCTAYTEKEKWNEFIEAGAIEHVSKPLNKSDLERVLRRSGVL